MMWAIVINDSTVSNANAVIRVKLSNDDLKRLEALLGRKLPDAFLIDPTTHLVYVVIDGTTKPFPLTHVDNLRFIDALFRL